MLPCGFPVRSRSHSYVLDWLGCGHEPSELAGEGRPLSDASLLGGHRCRPVGHTVLTWVSENDLESALRVGFDAAAALDGSAGSVERHGRRELEDRFRGCSAGDRDAGDESEHRHLAVRALPHRAAVRALPHRAVVADAVDGGATAPVVVVEPHPGVRRSDATPGTRRDEPDPAVELRVPVGGVAAEDERLVGFSGVAARARRPPSTRRGRRRSPLVRERRREVRTGPP